MVDKNIDLSREKDINCLNQENIMAESIFPREIPMALTDMKPPDVTREVETLLNTVENAGGSISDAGLQQVCSFLQNFRWSEVVNHDLLKRTFKCLQTWSISVTLRRLLKIGMVPILARTYDNLVQRDYSKREVLTSILDLLFVVEDMSESTEGKTECGKFFLHRLMALAIAKVPSVKLHRATVETLCAVITKSPANQQTVIDSTADCCELFTKHLRSCGDFQLQASIIEILFRLLKRGPQLLGFLPDKTVRGAMKALLQRQKPDLLSEIRGIVILLNESQGSTRSVYSFLVVKIAINGQKVATSDEMWVNFGKGQLSFYVSEPLSLDVEGPTIVDVEYEDIRECRTCSTTLLELLVDDKPNVFLGQVQGETSKNAQIQIYFSTEGMARFKECVLPKIRTRTNQATKGWINHCVKNTELKTSPPAALHVVGVKSCKSSVGITIPLPKVPISTIQGRLDSERSLRASNGVSKPTHQLTPRKANAGVDVRLEERQHYKSPQCPSMNQKDVSRQVVVLSGTPQKDLSRTTADSQKELPEVPVTALKHNLHSPQKPLEHKLQDCCEALVDPKLKIFKQVTPKQNVTSEHQEPDPIDIHVIWADNNTGSFKPETTTASNGYKQLILRENDQVAENENDSRIGPKTSLSTFRTLGKNVRGKFSVRMAKSYPPGTVSGSKLEKSSAGDAQYHFTNSGLDNQPNVRGKSKAVMDARGSIREEIQQPRCAIPRCEPTERSSEGGIAVKAGNRNLVFPCEDSVKRMPETNALNVPNDGPSSPKGTSNRLEMFGRDVQDTPTKPSDIGVEGHKRQIRARKCKQSGIRIVEPVEISTSAEEYEPEKSLGTSSDSMNIETNEDRPGARKGSRERRKPGNTVLRRKNQRPAQRVCSEKSAKATKGKAFKFTGRTEPRTAQQKSAGQTCVFSFTNEDERESWKQHLSKNRKLRQSVERKRKRKPGLDFCNDRSTTLRKYLGVDGEEHLMSSAAQEPPQAGSPTRSDSRSQEFPLPPQGVQSPVRQEQDNPNRCCLPVSDRCPQQYETFGKDRTSKGSRVERWKSCTRPTLKLVTSNMEATDTSEDSQGISPRKSRLALNVDLPDTSFLTEDSENVHLITSLLKSFKDKVKAEKKRKVRDIMSQASHLIQREVESTQQRVQVDISNFAEFSKTKYEQLESKLEGQSKKMGGICERFRQDFIANLEKYETIVSEIHETDNELLDLARQKGQEHKELLAHLHSSANGCLADADQKLLALEEASKSMHGLKSALRGVMLLEA